VWIDPVALLPPFVSDREPRPGDDRLRFVTGRRPTAEATFGRAAEETPGVTIKRGVSVGGLLNGTEAAKGIPHVSGVKLVDGEELRADLVVDTSGRRTKLPDWLAAHGARPPYVESEDRGFIYFTRYYTGPEPPVMLTAPLSPFGSVSLLTLQSDNNTWSLTIVGASADTALRGLRDPDRFTDVVRACPLHAHWTDGKPITDMLMMAGVLDKYRRYFVDDRPVATGVVAVGDAWACTNPSAGRGISVGMVHAQRLRDTVREGLDDPETFVRRFDEVTERDVAPFVRNQMANDRIRIGEMNARRDGVEPPAPDPTMAAVMKAVPRDPDVYRGFIETLTCLSLPQEVFARPGFMDKVNAYADDDPIVMPGPDRRQLLDLIGS
jgi:flavin-dependent dehydrogenase